MAGNLDLRPSPQDRAITTDQESGALDAHIAPAVH